MGKNEIVHSSLSKWVNISLCVTLTFRHLGEIKSVQGKFDYQRKDKESNEGDFIIKVKKTRAKRET